MYIMNNHIKFDFFKFLFKFKFLFLFIAKNIDVREHISTFTRY